MAGPGPGSAAWAGARLGCCRDSGRRHLLKQAAAPPTSASWQGRGSPASPATGSSARRTGWRCRARRATPSPPPRHLPAPRPASVVWKGSQSGGWRGGDGSGRRAGPQGQAAPLRAARPRRHSRAALCTAEPCPSLTMRQCGRALGLLAGQRGLLDLGGGTTPLGARRGNCDSGADTQQMANHVCASERRRAPCGFGFAGALPKMTFS